MRSAALLRPQRVKVMAGVMERPHEAACEVLKDRIAAAADRQELLEDEMTFEYCEMVSKSENFVAAGKTKIYYCCAHQCYHFNEDGVFSVAEIKARNPKARVCNKKTHSSVLVTQGRIVNGGASGRENELGKKWFAKMLKLKFVETRIEEGDQRSSTRGAPAVRPVRIIPKVWVV